VIPLNLEYIAEVTSGTLVGVNATVTGVACDSRKVERGALFVALRGRRTDGHNHVVGAVEKGAVAALVERNGTYGCPYILVRDTVEAIGQMARMHLLRHPTRVVAITGSMGKTSTKEMTAAALATRFSVFRSMGNLNTEIGLPISVLHHTDEEVMVLEMAMRGPGQIAELARIAPADVAVITNIGESHLEVMGTRGAIAAAKGEILSGMKLGGTAVLNRDDDYYEYLASLAQGPIISFGYHADADYRIADVKPMEGGHYLCRVVTGTESIMLRTPWPGLHNVNNAVAALVTAGVMGVALKTAVAGIEECPATPGRLRVLQLAQGVTVIDDTYNASPAATLSALSTLAEMPTLGRRIAVLGDMLELGTREQEAHEEVAAKAAEVCDMVITVGRLATRIADVCADKDIPAHRFTDRAGVAKFLLHVLEPGDLVLIKGSRGIGLEDVVTALFDGQGKE
jgi:UDP-N-acetylmuramoyl-tripeptide--D-alanyl-D-alanine ligase